MAIQLEDFARQVLFGATMEEKLSFPREEIVDTARSEAIKTPRVLSRPDHLVLRENGVKAGHPSQSKLVDEKERGRLLHFFGNHELLATELMALAILKFPDAPASFRRGLLETLKDEQMHTQLYLHRMQQCGVEFGALPLSDYFWRSVSSMEDPLDYVTRLSLTFEQANLDYSREYGKIFRQVGDAATAGILDKIYRDEIGHVGFGLKWFRRWKASGKTDWEAYRERLVFPLSPARAKGSGFNKEGRREAGLDAGFIEDLELFSQSRGRTPSVFWFNPDAESFAAADRADLAAGGASVVQKDLAFLPAYLSRRDDLLLLSHRPSAAFLAQLKGAGLELPELCCREATGPLRAPSIDRKLGALRPWAWTPDSVAFFSRTLPQVTRPPQVDTLWNAGIRQLYSKAWSAGWAGRLAAGVAGEDWMAPPEVYGEVVSDRAGLDAARGRFAAMGYGNLVCKAPFGTAATGLRCVMEGESLGEGPVGIWLERVLREQGAVVVEPWLDRVYDFSVQWECREGRLRLLGYPRLINNARGQFRGIVTNGFSHGLEPELVQFLMQRPAGRPRIYRWYEERLLPELESELAAVGFCGPLGIDALVYRAPDGGFRLKPVVELNPRYTMGRVALELGKRNAATSIGFFQVLTRSQVRKKGLSGFPEYVRSLINLHPVVLSEEAKPRIVSGSLALTDPESAQQFLAAYHLRTRFEELPL